jgi:hypothetical protein
LKKMVDVVIDVESDGPCPGLYSMISLGAVVVEPGFARTFKATFSPISNKWNADALAISKISRKEHSEYTPAKQSTLEFYAWLTTLGEKPTMWSDNPAYDWQWVNYYLHLYVGKNPMGWSARRISDLWCGMQGALNSRWKHLRDAPHTHDPLDDALGNAQALLKMKGMLRAKNRSISNT